MRLGYTSGTMAFSTIKDQAVPIRLLRSMMRKDRIPNGLLFWGPSGVGKRLAALEAAKAINCEGRQADACDACLSCRKVDHGTHPDLKVIIPSGKTRIINVEAVNSITELCSYRPFEGRYRVFVIEDADRMNETGQNHFLKTLEEPPSATVFMLLSEYPRQLLPTIRSRCQHVRFGLLRPQTVQELLMQHRPDTSAALARSVAAVTQGQMSRALDLLDSPKRSVVLETTARLAAGEDPLAVSEAFAKQVRASADAVVAQFKAESAHQDSVDMTHAEMEAAKEEEEAYKKMLIRRDTMEYLYLLSVWFRDETVVRATRTVEHAWNQDASAQLLQVSAVPPKEEKLAAIEQAWVYIERNLQLERVFRDLFFTLAA